MKRKSVLFIVILGLCLSLITVGCAQDSDRDGKSVIKISNTPYSSDWPSVYITKYVTEDLGYKSRVSRRGYWLYVYRSCRRRY